jgi:hypothetical protein
MMIEGFWRKPLHAVAGLVVAVLVAAGAHSSPPVLDPAAATAMFAEAEAVSERDGGALWGMALYGPMIFVDRASRKIIANRPDPEGRLHAEGGVWVGTLPPDYLPANTAIDWQGQRWTMLEWPIWGDAQARARLFAHEMFHRIQPRLHLLMTDKANPHLDTLEGRVWLQLEWRALAVAMTSSGQAQVQAIRDALAFRAHRLALFAGAADGERAMELNEGLAEYTGVGIAAVDALSARRYAAQKLLAASDPTFVRSFPYVSGPAYGLLLDQRAPGWRHRLAATSDLAGMLAASLPRGPAANAPGRAENYGAAALRLSEERRATEAEAVRAQYRAKLIDGAVLMLPNLGHRFRVSFNPSGLVPMGDAGTVYPTMQVSDEWGSLNAREGVLMAGNWSRVTVTAPADPSGMHIAGAGWSLDLAPGWRLVPGERPGSFTVHKD